MVVRCAGKFKRAFVCFCISAVAIIVFFDLAPYSLSNFKISFVNNNPFPPTIANKFSKTTVDEDIYQRYLEIKRDYTKKLSAIPITTYKPSEIFIDFGQPVKNYLPSNSSNIKRILAWTDFFRNKRYIPLKLECGNNITCEATYDKNDLLKSDAIVMHARNLGGIKGLPPKRLPHQRWVHYVMESPYHLGLQPGHFNGVFNYTMNYRDDSDSLSKYILVSKRKTPLLDDQYTTLITEIMASKSKLVSYMNSNCGASHTIRLSYIRELQKHIPVDTYGRCGKQKCARNSPECEKTMSSYKFFLSMENSHCRNYVEKPRLPLFRWRAVPIVMGGADPSDYERALPPGSYIHTAGFSSTKALAEYLLILDKNPALYESYHEWRRRYTDEDNADTEKWCILCRKISNDSLPVQTYRDFKGWYDRNTCHI